MPERPPPNPYIDLGLTDLAEALSQRAAALLQGQPVGRRDIAYLLIAAASKVRPQDSQPNAPARLVAAGQSTPLEAFADILEREQRALRWLIFNLAVDAAGGPIPGSAFDEVIAQAVESDEQWRAAMKRLSQDPPITRSREPED